MIFFLVAINKMSYSYLTNVFPNYTPSVDYEDYVFRSLNAIDKAETQAKVTQPPQAHVTTPRVIPNYSASNKPEQKVVPVNGDPMNYQLNEFTKSLIGAHPIAEEQGTYVHQPQNSIDPIIKSPVVVESFGNMQQSPSHTGCDKMCQHVLQCQRCKAIVVKQWNLESDRIFHEEIMEVLTYVIFAVFLLLLLESK